MFSSGKFIVLLMALNVFSGAGASAEAKHGILAGPFETFAHGVSGDLYILDGKTLGLQGFSYDGEGPATVFWVGLKGQHSLKIDDSGIPLLDENGRSGPLKRYHEANFTLALPESIQAQDLLWVAVWCQFFKIDFGHVIIPEHLDLKY